MKVEDMGYVEWMRRRLGYGEDDTSADETLESMEPLERVGLISGWVLGDDQWADTFKEYFESQGLYLTKNPEADGVID